MRTFIAVVTTTLFLASCGIAAKDGASTEAEAATAAKAKPPKVHTKTIISQPYHIDAKYSSMRGPWGMDETKLLDVAEPELVWITGYETTVVDAESNKEM